MPSSRETKQYIPGGGRQEETFPVFSLCNKCAIIQSPSGISTTYTPCSCYWE